MPRDQSGAKPPDKLTARQQKFIHYFLGQANGNASEAARLAGLKDPANTGYRLRRHPLVLAEIEKAMADLSMSQAEIIARLTDMARGAGGFVIRKRVSVETITRAGKPSRKTEYKTVIDLDALKSAGLMHLVKGVSYTKSGDEIIEFYDAQAALVTLAKHHGMLVNRNELTGKDGVPLIPMDGIADVIARVYGNDNEANASTEP